MRRKISPLERVLYNDLVLPSGGFNSPLIGLRTVLSYISHVYVLVPVFLHENPVLRVLRTSFQVNGVIIGYVNGDSFFSKVSKFPNVGSVKVPTFDTLGFISLLTSSDSLMFPHDFSVVYNHIKNKTIVACLNYFVGNIFGYIAQLVCNYFTFLTKQAENTA